MAEDHPPLVLTASQERFMSIIRDTDANIFITGDAGTGKTFAIDVAKKHFQEAGVRFATVAFTGSAAFNAGGVTIHSALYPLPFIPATEQNGFGSRLAVTLRGLVYQLLSDECGGQSRRSVHDDGTDDDIDSDGNSPAVGTAKIDWKVVDVLFIDEISLIDAALFALVDRRLQLIRGNSAPFGGLRVIAAGDFGQIPPLTPNSGPDGRGVASTGLFCFQTFILSPSNLPSGKETLAGKRYTTWQDAAFMYVRLHENVRSAGDDNLRRIAEHARIAAPGAWPAPMQQALLSRTYDSEEESVAANPGHKSSLHVYYSNAEVRARNAEMNNGIPGAVLSGATLNIPSVLAVPVSDSPHAGSPTTAEIKSAEADAKKCMPKSVVDIMDDVRGHSSFFLKAGTRIMVVENQRTYGVFNGALGTVVRMTRKRERQPNGEFQEVQAVRVRMDSTHTEVDIERRSATFTFIYPRGERDTAAAARVNVQCSWWPFTLGWAITYHKVQGQTILGPITLSVGNFKFWNNAGMLYVGVTRAQRLSQLALVPSRTQRARGLRMLECGFCVNESAVRFMNKLDRDAHFSEADAAAWEALKKAHPPVANEPEPPECVACTGKANCVLLPCAHMSTCVSCMDTIRATCGGRLPCPMCRGVASSHIRVLY